MSKEQEIIKRIFDASPDFLATSDVICGVLEAVKEECRYIETAKIDALIIEEHEKRNLPHPGIVRRTRAIDQLPELIEPLIIAAMKDQISSVGELCIPPRDDEDDDYVINDDGDVFSKDVIERYGVCSQETLKPEGYDEAEMTISLAGKLLRLFESYGCEKIYFTVRLYADEDDMHLVIDDVHDVDNMFRNISLHVIEYPQADDVERLVEYLKAHPNPNLLIHAIKYPKR